MFPLLIVDPAHSKNGDFCKHTYMSQEVNEFYNFQTGKNLNHWRKKIKVLSTLTVVDQESNSMHLITFILKKTIGFNIIAT